MNKALWAAAAVGVQVGAAIVASRHVVLEVQPATLALLRYGIGLFVILPFIVWDIFSEKQAVAGMKYAQSATKNIANLIVWRDWLAVALLGVLQFGLLIALLNLGLQHIGAAQAAMIFSLFPLLTLLLAAALGQERIQANLLTGILLSLAGIALVLWPKLSGAHTGGAQHWWGEGAVLLAAWLGALCSVLYRPYLRRHSPLRMSGVAMLACVLFLAALAWPEQWFQRWSSFSGHTWAILLFIGVSSGIGYWLWLYALQHESPARVTVFLALNPLTATLLGFALLAERPSWYAMVALILIAAGLWRATRTPTRS
jgi:drug/metabolite transporter (DMT)-like permease